MTMRSSYLPLTFMVAVGLGTGCANVSGDTSAYKPPPTITQTQADEQIAKIKADKSMPDGIKQMAIQTIQKQTSK